MTMWLPQQLDPMKPVFRAIADALHEDVRSGRLAPRERLPTHRDLARALRVNVVTVTRAYQEAARRGLVGGEVGRGTFVRGKSPGPARLRLPDGEAGVPIDFEQNIPATGDGSPEALSVFAEFAREPYGAHLFSGYSSFGDRQHREAGADWIALMNLTADAERVIICGGAQHAMSVAVTSLARPGDLVLCGELTYAGMTALAQVLQLRLQSVAMDAEGILPDALDVACCKGRARLLYCMPTLNNPTGRVMGAQRRADIVEVARRHGLAILEDDAYGFLCAEAPPPLVSYAPELGYYIATTSKALTPGLRIGYLLAPADRKGGAFERMTANLTTLGWMPAPLMSEVATRWIRSGVAERMVSELRREMVARRGLFDEIIGVHASASHASSCHLWMELPEPWRSADFVHHARRLGVALSSSEAFVVGRARAPHAVRICIGTPEDREDVRAGLQELAQLLEEGPLGGKGLV